MRIVNVQAHKSLSILGGWESSQDRVEQVIRQYALNSAPKNIGRELVSRGLASSFVEWRFWPFATKTISLSQLPLVLFQSHDGETMPDLEAHVAEFGEPDVIWAEGISFPRSLMKIFELCPGSAKIIYPKYCEPWLIEQINLYDLCLVDEPWQVDEMARRFPGVCCRVWDKLVDYEDGFYPIHAKKEFDVCYVARLHPRKNHWLLLDAMEKVRDRSLSVVLIGSDDNECRQFLEKRAVDAGVNTFFAGCVPPHRVNELINQSRMGVICDQYDAVPRAMLEYMAADVPVLVNADMRAGSRYVGPRAGLVRSPDQFHEGIIEILENPDRFHPRDYLIENYSQDKVLEKLWTFLCDLVVAK